MDAKTRVALEASIKKWEAIVAGTGEDHGADDCALCSLFAFRSEDADGEWRPCLGCPVRERTGQPGCSGSPYDAWGSTQTLEDGAVWRVHDDASRAAAQKQLDFLKSLRPAEAA